MRRAIACTGLVFLLVVFTSSPAGEKDAAWQRFLPEAAYAALMARANKIIDDAQAGKAGSMTTYEIETAMRDGYRLSVVGTPDDLKKIDASDLAGKLKMRVRRDEFLVAMMELYRNKAKGGEGIHEDLQYQPKLKNQNGIEALIGALASKKLSEENLAKVEKELPLLAYRIAVTANLTRYAAPKKDAERWNKLAGEMRDSAIALADAAKKKDAQGIVKSAESLQKSCTNCHGEFKK